MTADTGLQDAREAVLATSPAELGNEIGPDETGGGAYYDRDGWVMGRGVLPADLVRRVREPVVYELTAQGLIEAVPGNPDRFRWLGSAFEARLKSNGSDITHRYQDLAGCRPLVEHGHARRVAEQLWERPALLWANSALFTKAPAGLNMNQLSNIGHSDGWQHVGSVADEEHFNLWIPLTEFGPFEGALAMHAKSYENRPERYPDVPDGVGPVQVAEQGWRVSGYRVGDAILFRPDIVHHSAVNQGPDLRLAIVIRGQRADAFRAPAAGMSYDQTQPLSTLEGLILALLAVGPRSGWAIGVEFAPRGLVGRFYPLPAPGQISPADNVKQALQLLRLRGLSETRHPGRPGAVQDTVTEQGAEAARAWLAEPVRHVEELAGVVPAKLALLAALGASPSAFIAEQREALDQLDAAVPADNDRIVVARHITMVAATRALLAAA